MIMPPDIEMFVCSTLRERIRDQNVQIGVTIPADYAGQYPLIIVRDDGGPVSDTVCFDKSLGITVQAGTRRNSFECRQLARRVFATLTDPRIMVDGQSPVAAIVESGCNGPYAMASDHDTTSCYMTIQYSTVGEVIN